MSENLEIEFKNLLNQNEFLRLISYFDLQSNDFLIQENHYFDTPDFQLKELYSGLRIRILPNQAELTLKIPAEVGLIEITDPLTLETAKQCVRSGKIPETGHVHNKLLSLNISESKLSLIGSLKTKRAEKHIPQGLLALDENWYAQQHDFEMELEVLDAPSGERAFLQLLDKLSIERKPSLNKIQRMMLATYPKK